VTFRLFLSLTAAAAFAALCSAQQTPAGNTPGGAIQTPGSQQGAAAGSQGRGRRGPALPEGPTPRTEDGHPDLSGNWTPNAIGQNVDMVRSGVEVPFQSWAYDVWKTHKDSNSKDDPEARCLPPGVPRMSTTPYPWTFVQTPKMLVIVYEGGAHIWRKVFMDGRGHDPNVQDTWLGDSIGHWEGDTLVVETVGQNDKTWIDEAGIPHSSDMKVIEKISRPDLAHLTIEHIIDDPKTFTKPWTFTTHPTLLRGELIEYICQENNRDVEHLFGK
jgi:hypothetical protein